MPDAARPTAGPTAPSGAPPASPSGRATLAQVAHAAGVSPATASKVLNGRPDVSEATRRKVRAAISRLGYRPTTAHQVAGPPTVMVVFDAVESLYSTHVLTGLLAAAGDAGVQIVVGVLEPPEAASPEALEGWARGLIGEGRRGAIFVTCELTGEQIAACARIDLPVVAIDSYSLLESGMVTVGSTNFAGGMAAARHLIDLGHRRLGLVGGPARSIFAQERVHGFRAAQENAGLSPDPSLIRSGLFDYDSGVRLGGQLLDAPRPPTAIVAACDPCAVGVMEAARSRGLRVPQDLSVVGFDDTALARWTTPQLTTVRQPLADMGRVALRTVLRLADGRPADSQHVQLATTLVVRDSTAPPA